MILMKQNIFWSHCAEASVIAMVGSARLPVCMHQHTLSQSVQEVEQEYVAQPCTIRSSEHSDRAFGPSFGQGIRQHQACLQLSSCRFLACTVSSLLFDFEHWLLCHCRLGRLKPLETAAQSQIVFFKVKFSSSIAGWGSTRNPLQGCRVTPSNGQVQLLVGGQPETLGKAEP